MAISFNAYDWAEISSPVSGETLFSGVITGILQGDTLVLGITARDSRVSVASVTDSYGNTWEQIPGARSTSGDYDGGPTYGEGDSLDLWIAQDVAASGYNGNPYLDITVDFVGGAPAEAAIQIFDITGCPNGCTVASVGTASANTSGGSVTGPALTADSGALYLAVLSMFGAGNSEVNVATPWSTRPESKTLNPGTAGASATEASGVPPVFLDLFSGNFPWSISAVALVATTSGGGASTGATFLGSVRVVGSAPSGPSNPFLGTVKVVSSAPSGQSNPYLGSVVQGTPGADTGNPALGEVVVVSDVPAGETDVFLGTIEESS